jgi:hypothetical protein
MLPCMLLRINKNIFFCQNSERNFGKRRVDHRKEPNVVRVAAPLPGRRRPAVLEDVAPRVRC